MKCRAYLDIETTGLSRHYAELTVIGIAIESGSKLKVVQLFEDNLTDTHLLEALEGVERIYTYNGSRFDLPFIKAKLHIDLKQTHKHIDLMYTCWKQNLYGGLKEVEKKLQIKRKLQDIDGRMAVRLWYDYVNNYDKDALKRLLKYNREDTVNLRLLRRKLRVD